MELISTFLVLACTHHHGLRDDLAWNHSVSCTFKKLWKEKRLKASLIQKVACMISVVVTKLGAVLHLDSCGRVKELESINRVGKEETYPHCNAKRRSCFVPHKWVETFFKISDTRERKITLLYSRTVVNINLRVGPVSEHWVTFYRPGLRQHLSFLWHSKISFH